MFLVFHVLNLHREEPVIGIYGWFESEEQFLPLPPGEFAVWDVKLNSKGWPQSFKRHPKGHLKVIAPEPPPNEVEILAP